MDWKQLPKDVQEALHGRGPLVPRNCALCSKKPSIVGFFMSNEEMSAKLGVAKGKTRLMIYGLCDPCSLLPNVVNTIERKMLAEAQAKRN